MTEWKKHQLFINRESQFEIATRIPQLSADFRRIEEPLIHYTTYFASPDGKGPEDSLIFRCKHCDCWWIINTKLFDLWRPDTGIFSRYSCIRNGINNV